MKIYVIANCDGISDVELIEEEAIERVMGMGERSSPYYEEVYFRFPELEYLRWFHINADFGPAHGDVVRGLNERYAKETGRDVPEGYKEV